MANARRRVVDVDDTELWREYRRAQQQRRADRLPSRTDDILALRGKGFDVHELTPYQFRIDGVLDLFPVHQRYHHIPTNRRGGYRNPMSITIHLLKSR